jgi:hypothetical protein
LSQVCLAFHRTRFTSRIDPPRFLILDENINEVCLCRFVEEYEKHNSLIRYFSKPKFKEYPSKLFGTMKYFKQFNTEEYEKLSNHDKFLQLDNSDVQSESSESNDVEKETNPMHENDNEVLSNTDNLHQDSSINWDFFGNKT